uniref:Prefoldin subunit 4 n=1 Tax=Blastobotrys adeninivorans TaxID=409370 RepID=A0A060T987_BLAAD
MKVLPEGETNDVEVQWEDQKRINTFSKLNSKLEEYEEQLKGFKTEKEYLDDVSMEMELVDEDEMVHYKIGDSFVQLPQSEVMERLEADVEKINKQVADKESEVESITEELEQLKKQLYAKFGHAINLER